MPDTPRTLATALSLLADNTTNAISPQDLRDVVVSITSAVGGGGFDHIGENGVYDVTKWGALGNGSHNDTTNIQTVIDTCAAAGGGIVYFPPGTYKITATLVIDENNGAGYQTVSLLGAGSAATTISGSTTSGTDLIFWGTSGGIARNLSAPKSMAFIQGIGLQGPGRANANSIGIHAKEASYYEFKDIFVQGCETSFHFDTGHSFTTGATLIRLRTLSCKYGYVFDDKDADVGAGTPTLGECTDMTLISCYANPAGNLTGSVGYWCKRMNTSWFFRTSAEAFDYGIMLGISGTGGIADRNTFVASRTENIVVNDAIVYDGNDNWILGGTASWTDTSNAQSNVLLGGKYNVAGDAATPDSETRLVRPITAALLPAANAGQRGKLFYRPGNAGTADQLLMCKKSAADVYSWVNIA